MSHLRYRPEIDGLRAVAVVPVVLYHLSADWLRGGYLGVDVFFVISGFLITSLIIKDYEKGEFSMIRFWRRRIRRILPAQLAMLFVLLVLGPLWLSNRLLIDQVFYTLLSVINFFLWNNTGDYWGIDNETIPLLNMWSLAIEEQFYLFYPLILVFLLGVQKRWERKENHSRLAHLFPLAAVGLIVLVSSICYLNRARHDPGSAFFLLPFRAWELGIGCLLAIGTRQFGVASMLPGRIHQPLALLGLGVLIGTYFLVSVNGVVPKYVIGAVAGTVLVILFTPGPDNVCRRVLSWGPIVYVGKISYSLYLWHWPMIVFWNSRLILHDQSTIRLVAAATFLPAAILSYHFIEQPFRNPQRRLRWIGYAYAATGLLTLGMSWATTQATPINWFQPTLWYEKEYNMSDAHMENDRSDQGILFPEIDLTGINVSASGLSNQTSNDQALDVFVIGDSHAIMYAETLRQIFDETGLIYRFALANGVLPFHPIPLHPTNDKGCFRTPEEHLAYQEMKLRVIDESAPRLVIVNCRWDKISDIATTFDLMDYLHDRNIPTLFIEQPPLTAKNYPRMPKMLSYLGFRPHDNDSQYLPINHPEEYQHARDVIRQICQRYPNCDFVPIDDLFRRDNTARVLQGDRILYIDDDHLSHAGAQLVKDRLRDKIDSMLKIASPNSLAKSAAASSN